jgi:hypothetical protein
MMLSFIIILSFSCSEVSRPLQTVSITETAGISRDLEYVAIPVELERSLDGSRGICMKEQDKEDLILGQILDSTFQSGNKISYSCLFPISIKANMTKHYEIYLSEDGKLHDEQLVLKGPGANIKLENTYFVADLTDVKANPQNGLGSGQLAGLVLKQFDDKLLERYHINMHWAPNFQKEGLDYKTFGHIIHPDSTFVQKGPYKVTMYKSGYVEGYDEIRVSGTYEFFAGLPYFIFSSEIKMERETELMLLRNDEMTMDSLFTDVMYMHPDGETGAVALYNDKEMQDLEQDPIRDDATWLFFYHDMLNYGFGSIRMYYDNTNLQGDPSPLYEQHTKITPSANNGRYWNRRLVHEYNTLIPAGSRYTEKNAYLVFRAHPENPSGEIVKYHRLLTSPLAITTEAHAN